MRDSAQPAKKRRRSRRGRKIRDAEIVHLLEKHPPPRPPGLPLLPWALPHLWPHPIEVEIERLKKWDAHEARLIEASDADKEFSLKPLLGIPSDKPKELFAALGAFYDRAIDRGKATDFKQRVDHLAALLKAEGVAEPKPRARDYYAGRGRGNAMRMQMNRKLGKLPR